MIQKTEKWKIPEDGLWGFSHCGSHDTWYPWSSLSYEGKLSRLLCDLKAQGANSFRPQIHWHRVEPLIDSEVRRLEDVTEDMVRAYIESPSVKWKEYDMLIDGLISEGIEPHMVVGAAYDFQIPQVKVGENFVRALPDTVGRDRYLAFLYLHARACAKRYKGKVHIWQLENELNCAGETMLLVRWRSGRAWLDFGFLTAIIEVLSEAILTEDSTNLRSHNFYCSLRLFSPAGWRQDIKRWLDMLDIIGVDPYPNYIFGWPVMTKVVGKKVRQAREAGGKPVMVLESGYPAKPARRGVNEKRQALYARRAVEEAVSAGACGFYYYQLCSTEGYPVEGPWSNKFFQSIEPWWGFIRKDDSLRPGWYAYKEAIGKAREGRMKKH